MSRTGDVLYRVMADCRNHGSGVLETICEAIHELNRAQLPRESPPEPLCLVCVIGDALDDARHTGAITADEAFEALREMLDWAQPMVEGFHDQATGEKRPPRRRSGQTDTNSRTTSAIR